MLSNLTALHNMCLTSIPYAKNAEVMFRLDIMKCRLFDGLTHTSFSYGFETKVAGFFSLTEILASQKIYWCKLQCQQKVIQNVNGNFFIFVCIKIR